MAIDDAQQRELSIILSEVLPFSLGTIVVRSNPSGRPKQTGYSVSHEYLIFSGVSADSKIGRLPPTDNQKSRFNELDNEGPFEWRNLRREGSDSDRNARRSMYYPLFISPDKQIVVPDLFWDTKSEEWQFSVPPPSHFQIVWPINESGEEKRWRWEKDTVAESIGKLAVRRDRSGKDYIYYKRRPHDDGVVSISTWFDAKYSATEHGSTVLKSIFKKNPFDFPKSVHAVYDSIYISGGSKPDSIVLDFFGGSGTTGHAVINLNREDQGTRKYILVEMGEYFDSVTKPRIQKVVYSPNWKDGKPTVRDKGVSHAFKYLRLESYEDTLTNLAESGRQLAPSSQQQALLAQSPALREDYLLRYALDLESKEPLLPQVLFERPWDARMHITRDNALVESAIDMPETFNYLLGLVVENVRLSTAKNSQGTNSQVLALEGHINPMLRQGKEQRVLVLWRNLTGPDALDNLSLNTWFSKYYDTVKKADFDLIYVNGDCLLQNVKYPAEEGPVRFKVNLLEAEFARLMWEGTD
jgi:adenine-specific DNA-methyltransferase